MNQSVDGNVPPGEDPSIYSERPIIFIGGKAKDLSNLCLRQPPNDRPPRVAEAARCQSPLDSVCDASRVSAAALATDQRYPGSDDFLHNSMSDVSVDEIFNEVPHMIRGAVASRRQSSSNGGARARYAVVSQSPSSPPPQSRRRGSSIDIDRVDDWIVEPVDLVAKSRRAGSTTLSSPLPTFHLNDSTVEETDSQDQLNVEAPAMDRRRMLSRFPSQEILYQNEQRPPSPPRDLGAYETFESEYRIHAQAPPPPPRDSSFSTHMRRPSLSISQPSSISTNSDWLIAPSDSYSPSPSRHRRPSLQSTVDSNYNQHSFDHDDPLMQRLSTPPSPPPPAPVPPHDVVEIEIAPGEYLPLRGSRETLSAIESGKAQRVSCMACGVLLACISDCLMVICPECRCVSHTPNESDSSTIWLRLDDSDGAGGLGSGGYDGGSPFLNRSHNHRQLEPMGLNWWEREDDEHEGSFLGGFAARHRQEATMRRRASTSAISTQPKYGVGLGLKVEG